jgi:hypothetical protein
MHDDPTQRYSAAACAALFVRLFPHGGAGQDILTDIAPAGWAYSPLLAIFHPSLEQVYQEAVQLQRNMQLLAHYLPHRPLAPAPTFQEIAATFQPTPIDTVSEVRELVGTCLWDIFSHNHAVIGPEGRLVDIGSFRGASRFIATWLNRQTSENTYDYVDFYMGSIWIAQRADLTPVYEMIFRRLKACHHRWRYTAPEDDVDALAPSPAAMRTPVTAGDTAYLARPPATVQAYRNVYGQWPEGWPPIDTAPET